MTTSTPPPRAVTPAVAPIASPVVAPPLATRLPPGLWLLLGVLLNAAVGMRWNMAELAWVAAVPWLIHLRQTSGWRARAWLFAALQLATVIQVSKIISAPVPWIFAPLFSVPMAFSMALGLFGFEFLRRRLGDGWGLALFPAIVVVLEWAGSSASEFGSWGAAAYTQINNLPLLQTTALVGLSGIALLTAAVSAWTALVLSSPEPRRWLLTGGVIGCLVLAALAYGSIRIFTVQTGPLVTVAGVVSDLVLSPGKFPDATAVQTNDDQLFARTALAVRRGARLVVWNEGATLTTPANEAALVARGLRVAKQSGVDLVLAYVVPTNDAGTRFENKFTWLAPEGVIETYHKRHPVPGEGATPGDHPGVVHHRPYGAVAGAICYDYDFPGLGLAHARAGAGLVVVPSSDWLGIDPYHTQMARIRGIEGGFSVVRPVRAATSGAYDAYGRTRATLSWFEDNDRVLLAQVPVAPVMTVYARIGDSLAWLCLAVLLGGIGLALGQTVSDTSSFLFPHAH